MTQYADWTRIILISQRSRRAKDVLLLNNPATAMYFSQGIMRARLTFCAAMNSGPHMYENNFWEVKEPYEACSRQGISRYFDSPLCELAYKVMYQIHLTNTAEHMFETDDLKDFCDLLKKLRKLGRHGHVFLIALRNPLWFLREHTLTLKKKILSDGEQENIKVWEEEVLEVKRKPLFSNLALSYYERFRSARCRTTAVL